MKINKIIIESDIIIKASKLEFINDYIQILKGRYNKNNLYLAKYKNDENINLNNSQEFRQLIYTQLDIMRKINIGKALKNDIFINE